MKRIGLLVLLATAGVAQAKPAKLTPTKIGKVTIGVPAGYKAAVGDRCIALDGPVSISLIPTTDDRDAFEKAVSKDGAERVEHDKILCYLRSVPGANGQCLVTTAGGRWFAQFVSVGTRNFAALGGPDAIQAIADSVRGFEPKGDNRDCPQPAL